LANIFVEKLYCKIKLEQEMPIKRGNIVFKNEN